MTEKPTTTETRNMAEKPNDNAGDARELEEMITCYFEESKEKREISGRGWQNGFMGVFLWKLLQQIENADITEAQREDIIMWGGLHGASLAIELWHDVLVRKIDADSPMIYAERFAERYLDEKLDRIKGTQAAHEDENDR